MNSLNGQQYDAKMPGQIDHRLADGHDAQASSFHRLIPVAAAPDIQHGRKDMMKGCAGRTAQMNRYPFLF